MTQISEVMAEFTKVMNETRADADKANAKQIAEDIKEVNAKMAKVLEKLTGAELAEAEKAMEKD